MFFALVKLFKTFNWSTASFIGASSLFFSVSTNLTLFNFSLRASDNSSTRTESFSIGSYDNYKILKLYYTNTLIIKYYIKKIFHKTKFHNCIKPSIRNKHFYFHKEDLP